MSGCRQTTNVSRIVGKEVLAPGIVRLFVDAPQIARRHRAGQFVIVRLQDGGERIPLTIADTDLQQGTIALVVQAVGKTTRQLNARAVGDDIRDVAGPLGRPANVGRVPEPVCCVAGGIGAAVILPIARSIHCAGGRLVVVHGARTKELVILERELRDTADEYRVTTDDGSYGRRGLVTGVVNDLLISRAPIGRVIVAGPVSMMRAVCDMTRPAAIPTVASLNPIMIDGTGMCGGCRVSVGGALKFACVDGPEFDGHEVDFDELMARLSAFREHEWVAMGQAG